ncbi:FAD-binding oxidoreductase [Leucobacter sp. G161]|uniref:NAD(P)/FAD-dependent oxidoreductase n=1 Tax=Leucobacter sp. G161 TaxID=663704 RepID=UPI00073BDFDF|nr:FAD-dependent oxidoreductase [Leucobacter sp. G161]KUF06966.1 hypothetical protein AUL38_01235 [Leucobacter sp. G161]
MPQLSTSQVIIVGAGVLGASIAYHLAASGRAVTIVERGTVASGATSASFGWVGLAKSAAHAYQDPLRAEAAEHFARLRRDLSHEISVVGDGAISWENSPAETRAFVEEHRSIGHDLELVTRAEALEREPMLCDAPEVVALARGDVAVNAADLTRGLLRAAASHGARLLQSTEVTTLIRDERRVTGVRTAAGDIAGSTVVLAAGTATAALAAPLDVAIEVEASPSCLLTFTAPGPILRGILSTPEFEIRQPAPHLLLGAEDVPIGFAGSPRDLAAETLAAIGSGLRGGDRVALLDARIGRRPVPHGGAPLVGFAERIDGLYLAVAHPGVILAGAIGARVAGELA